MNRELPPKPVSRSLAARIARGIAATACAVIVVCGVSVPAGADDLDDRKEQLKQQLAEQSAAVDEAQANYNTASAAATQAKQDLADAQAALAQAQSDQVRAEELDAQRQRELEEAEKKLKQAKADVAAAQAALDSVNERLNEEILVTTQQNNGLANLALLFTDLDAGNLNQRAQMAYTLFNSSTAQLDELETRRLALESAEAEADAAESAADEARTAAANQLQSSKDATAKAEELEQEVTRLSAAKDAAEKSAANEVATEEQRQRDIAAESSSVEKRIQDRIAAEKKAADEKEAREKAERDNAAAKSSQSSSSSSSSSSQSSSASSSSGSKSFIYPVSARITSKYGMRLHPVLGYWKLHDGTDFGASCNTPIRAAASGTVTERYYNAGYGNRLMIDHGRVNGSYVTTGYNHATRYVVSVGQRVAQGQVIGYVGTTGYSTGCHLHLMVWENGKLVNPMAKWFG